MRRGRETEREKEMGKRKRGERASRRHRGGGEMGIRAAEARFTTFVIVSSYPLHTHRAGPELKTRLGISAKTGPPPGIERDNEGCDNNLIVLYDPF